MMPAPVRIQSGIGHGNHSGDVAGLNFSRERFRDGGPPALCKRVRLQKFLPHRAQVNEMFRLAEIFLRGLDFGDYRRLLHCTEQRMERFTRLKIYRSIFYLYHDVRTELSVQSGEFDVSTLGTVRVN